MSYPTLGQLLAGKWFRVEADGGDRHLQAAGIPGDLLLRVREVAGEEIDDLDDLAGGD